MAMGKWFFDRQEKCKVIDILADYGNGKFMIETEITAEQLRTIKPNSNAYLLAKINDLEKELVFLRDSRESMKQFQFRNSVSYT